MPGQSHPEAASLTVKLPRVIKARVAEMAEDKKISLSDVGRMLMLAGLRALDAGQQELLDFHWKGVDVLQLGLEGADTRGGKPRRWKP